MIRIRIRKPVLQSRNYLFLAPTWTIISAPAPAPAPATAIYWQLKVKTVIKHKYYTGTNRGRNDLFFMLASSKLTAENVY